MGIIDDNPNNTYIPHLMQEDIEAYNPNGWQGRKQYKIEGDYKAFLWCTIGVVILLLLIFINSR